MGALLLIAMALWCGAVSAAQAAANLQLTKTLHNEGSITAGDQIIWNITLTNSGPDAAPEVTVTDDMSLLRDVTLDLAEASDGTTYDQNAHTWTVPPLTGDGASATLNLTMTLAEDAAPGEIKNCVSITAPSEEISETPVCASATITAEAADLELTKTLFNTGPIFAGDQVIWNITLTNQGTAGVTDIVVTEDPSALGDFTLVRAEASAGSAFDDATNTWTIDSLAGNGATATLNLTMTLAEDAIAGELKNCAKITSPAQAGSEPVCTSGETSPTVKLDVTIKPETLNLKSRGVFTAFIRLAGDTSQEGITLRDISSITCGGAPSTKVKMNQKAGGTLMAKFRRQSLGKDVVAGETVEIVCNGTVTKGGETVKVIGSDTIRVIGEKKTGLDAFFSDILDTVAPLDEVGEGTDETSTSPTATPTVSPDQNQNRGQLKKQERNQDGSCTENCATGNSKNIKGNNGKKSASDDEDDQADTQGQGNQGNGNGNGKGNKDKEKGQGNGNNKK
ncbi:MAG TPA: DUF11 domain-containing protein [Methanomicrobiales archaeon]|nr:DUF11 domain-containing protein [Methanomicrobiales archaeon]